MKLSRSAAGVTLAELLVSIVIITGVLSGILTFYNSSIKLNLKNQVRTQLKYRAEMEMESIMSFPYPSENISAYAAPGGVITFREDGDYYIKRTIMHLDPETGVGQEPAPVNAETDKKLKKIIISVVRKDGIGGQIDLVNFKSP